MTIQPFRSIIKNYRVIFLDSYGVLKTYKGLIPGAIETIQYILESGREFYVLTNDASRSPQQLAEKFHNIGLETIKTEHIVSSGMFITKGCYEIGLTISILQKSNIFASKRKDRYLKELDTGLKHDLTYTCYYLRMIPLFTVLGFAFCY